MEVRLAIANGNTLTRTSMTRRQLADFQIRTMRLGRKAQPSDDVLVESVRRVLVRMKLDEIPDAGTCVRLADQLIQASPAVEAALGMDRIQAAVMFRRLARVQLGKEVSHANFHR